jgi:hypothetical protein
VMHEWLLRCCCWRETADSSKVRKGTKDMMPVLLLHMLFKNCIIILKVTKELSEGAQGPMQLLAVCRCDPEDTCMPVHELSMPCTTCPPSQRMQQKPVTSFKLRHQSVSQKDGWHT